MSVIFESVTIDGKKVRLTETQWLHIVFYHPELREEQNKIEKTVSEPDAIMRGAIETARVYYKFYRSTPVASKYLVVVVKMLDEEGFIVTSYFTERMKKGEIVWRRRS